MGTVSGGVATALSNGFDGVQADVVTIVTTALPPALAVMAIGLAITIGIKAFKRIANKG